jgi:hypothetical protein
MKNLLQYAYSIVVFIGVLSTAYLAVNKEGAERSPLRAMQPAYRSEATIVDPAVTQLFQMEDALARLDKGEKAETRKPSRIEIVIPSVVTAPDSTTAPAVTQ